MKGKKKNRKNDQRLRIKIHSNGRIQEHYFYNSINKNVRLPSYSNKNKNCRLASQKNTRHF